MKTKKPLGFILYSGPSSIDGAPIVVLASLGKSRNRKTGDMVQTWILRQDQDPTDAVRSGSDAAICGNCPHRGDKAAGLARTCYVNVGNAPKSVWKAYRAGRYVSGTMEDLLARVGSRPIRAGAYGDPAAAPFETWTALSGRRHTGYTHQWRTCDQRYRTILQASCDSPADAIDAARMGWNAFIVRAHDAPETGPETGRRSIECLAESRGASCAQCGVCDGTKIDVWIRAHGTAKRLFTPK